MSDTINQKTAINNELSIRNRFETAVFLIAYGLAEKDRLYESDPHKYSYSSAFRHGLSMLAALCIECSDRAEELLSKFNESDFIREIATLDVREWVALWRDDCKEALEQCSVIENGPLACVDSGYFSATTECYEILRFAEPDLMGGYQERKVYEFLRAGSQEQYVFGRKLLVRHPLLTWNEYVQIKTGLFDFGSDPLDQGESSCVDSEWLEELVSIAYEPVPNDAKKCPSCGWTMTMRGIQAHCSSSDCAKGVGSGFAHLDDVPHDAYRLTRGVMHYISSPGGLEVAIAEQAVALGLKYEMWPLMDTCDVMVELANGKRIAIDAKTHKRAERLAREIEHDMGISQLCADEVIYVVPDQVAQDYPGYCKVCNAVLSDKDGYRCMTYRSLVKRLAASAKEA